MTDIAAVAAQAAEKMMQVAEKYGPGAVDLTLEVGRIAAAQTIVPGMIALVAAVFLLPKAVRSLCEANAASAAYYAPGGDRAESEAAGRAWLLFWICAVPSVPASLLAAFCLSNAFAWVGLFRPEVYLAAKLLNL